MTDQPTNDTDQPVTPRPGATVDFDFTVDLIENAHFVLFDVFRANVAATKSLIIRGKTFRNCMIEGPAVIMPVEGCSFDLCDFGHAAGDIRNLLLRPVGDKVTGAMAFADTKFERCTFFAMGFTGPPQLLEEFMALQPGLPSQGAQPQGGGR
jgi:hypothetical protein